MWAVNRSDASDVVLGKTWAPGWDPGWSSPMGGDSCFEVGQSQGWRAPERKPPQHACWGDVWNRVEPLWAHLPKTPHWTWAYFFQCDNPHHHHHFQALLCQTLFKCCAYINSFKRVLKATSQGDLNCIPWWVEVCASKVLKADTTGWHCQWSSFLVKKKKQKITFNLCL